ncbi:MAG: Gldg family protein [Candidatus Omnitrophica bacterium]|nr:Gldg family protein [Candidatus Omnitrophota bacterium]
MNDEPKKYPLFVLFFLSLACLLYAFGLWFIEHTLYLRCIFLFAIGGFSFLLTLGHAIYLKAPKSKNFYKKCFFASTLIALWVVWLTAVNFLGSRYDIHYDVTAFQQHTMSENTVELLKNLKTKVRITVLYVGSAPKYLEDLLNGYKNVSAGLVEFEIIDPIENIGYAARFGNVISGKQKKVILESGKERQDVDFSDQDLDENLLNNALVRVTRLKRTAYFLTGHREYNIFETSETGLSTFASLLDDNNIKPRRLLLDQNGVIPKDCDVLIIAGPRSFLSPKEEKAIEDYLEQGGDALFLIENTVVTTPDKPLTEKEKELNPSLNSILNQWGVNVEKDVVVDLASHASGDVGSPATRNYMTHRAIVGDLDYTFYVRPRSISMTKDRRQSIKLAPLVLTASDQQSWGETNRYLNVKYDAKEDRPGPVPIAYVVWEAKSALKDGKVNGKDKPSDTRIAVFTDADFLTNAFINQYSNAQMGLNVVNWLSEMDYKPFVKNKHVEVVRLDLTSKQKRVVAFILFLMPLTILIASLIFFFSKKS